jgi:hypothetical protein
VPSSRVWELCDEQNIHEWSLMDINDPGYQILSDDEIIRSLYEVNNTECEENETDDLTEGENGSFHSEASDALDLAFKWFERQEESNTSQLLQLRRSRDLATLKKKSTMNKLKIFQNKINNMPCWLFFRFKICHIL